MLRYVSENSRLQNSWTKKARQTWDDWQLWNRSSNPWAFEGNKNGWFPFVDTPPSERQWREKICRICYQGHCLWESIERWLLYEQQLLLHSFWDRCTFIQATREPRVAKGMTMQVDRDRLTKQETLNFQCVTGTYGATWTSCYWKHWHNMHISQSRWCRDVRLWACAHMVSFHTMSLQATDTS